MACHKVQFLDQSSFYFTAYLAVVFVLFTDDSTTSLSHNSPKNIFQEITRDNNTILNWFNTNRLPVNSTKTQWLHLSLKSCENMQNTASFSVICLTLDCTVYFLYNQCVYQFILNEVSFAFDEDDNCNGTNK